MFLFPRTPRGEKEEKGREKKKKERERERDPTQRFIEKAPPLFFCGETMSPPGEEREVQDFLFSPPARKSGDHSLLPPPPPLAGKKKEKERLFVIYRRVAGSLRGKKKRIQERGLDRTFGEFHNLTRYELIAICYFFKREPKKLLGDVNTRLSLDLSKQEQARGRLGGGEEKKEKEMKYWSRCKRPSSSPSSFL